MEGRKKICITLLGKGFCQNYKNGLVDTIYLHCICLHLQFLRRNFGAFHGGMVGMHWFKFMFCVCINVLKYKKCLYMNICLLLWWMKWQNGWQRKMNVRTKRKGNSKFLPQRLVVYCLNCRFIMCKIISKCHTGVISFVGHHD